MASKPSKKAAKKAVAGSGKPKLTKLQALQRTKSMLVRVWALDERPKSGTSLRDNPPDGLGKHDNAIRALRTPIISNDFAPYGPPAVTTDDLVKAKTVGELRDEIWDKIPNDHKIEN
jgi:hypothetical protein